jgi:hypothetical protein
MIPSPASLSGKALIGNDSAWLLAFHKTVSQQVSPDPVLEIGRDDYYAEVQASLPSGLEGGVYSFVIEGLTDEHYAKIAQKGPDAPNVVRLYMFWRDTNSSIGGYLSNLAGLTDLTSAVKASDIPDALVADLRIVSVTRKAGTRRYETTVTARERIFESLANNRLAAAVDSLAFPQALQELLRRTCGFAPDRDFKTYGTLPTENRSLAAGKTALDHLRLLGQRLEESTAKYGRGMFLIRDGVLHIGPRPIPVDGDSQPPKKLTLAAGLIETAALDPVPIDPNFDASTGDAPTRRQFRLTLKGRPDIKPGDMVEFDSPPEDVSKTTGGLLGAIGDLLGGPLLPSLGDETFQNPVQLYVSSVEHKLGRTSGFVTTAVGVEITGTTPDDRWDKRTPQSGQQPAPTESSANPEVAAARAVRQMTQSSADSRNFPELAEVRRMTATGSAEPPSQTVKLWRGLAPGDGGASQARRLAIQRPSPAPIDGVPYVTPYAWGKTGLVLPRYPGTRVLVEHRNGSSDDPVDAGALWESGHGPDSQPGDWWLILPVGVPQDKRSSLTDDQTPQEHTGPVSQDLIDADGNRVIEAGEFVVRVSRNSLKSAGQRPSRASDADSITIEHADGGSKITLKSDGTIQIKGTNIEFEASGKITLKASEVDVQ